MRQDPVILLVEPDLPITFLAPTRRGGCCRLHDWVFPQVIAGRHQCKDVGGRTGASHEPIEKLRPLVPPMPEQLCIVRRQDNGWAAERLANPRDLGGPRCMKMARVFRSCAQRSCAVVNLLWPG